MQHNKLIRDKIPEIIKEKGGTYKTHTADNNEYWYKLKEKLSEEVEEFLESENKDELVDILEVVYAILDYKNITREEIEKKREAKTNKRGAFKKKIILEESKNRAQNKS